jgi:membrane-bound lytic murein transglycosylase C
MKKILALLVIAPLLISCSGKKSTEVNEAWVKDTNGFEILMGQFAHNIENIWGLNEVLIAGPKDYVKYTDQYQTRSHINFDSGAITIETIATTDPAAHLRQAIISTLLMGDDPGSIDLYSDVNDIQISKEPFLYGQVLDNKGAPIRWEWRAAHFADYLLQTKLQKRTSGLHVILLGHYSAGAKPPGQTCPQIPADGSQGVGEIRRGRVADPGDHADRIEL